MHQSTFNNPFRISKITIFLLSVFLSCHNVITGLVYAAKGGDVAMTMVRGNILYQNGRFPTIDLNAVVEELTGYAIPRLFAKEEDHVG